MPSIKLTQHRIKRLTHTGKWINDYWDTELPGFGLRVHPSGRKVFCVRYAGEDGKRRRVSLGRFPILDLAEAREKAKVLVGQVAQGEDPQAERAAEKELVTFGELAEQYLRLHAKRRKRAWHEDERILQTDLLPTWQQRKATTIGRREVSELLDTIVERGAPIMANRTKALISKVYNFGISRDLVENNPCQGVPMPSISRQRDRVLSEDEIQRFWGALRVARPVTAATFKMRLLTAQRGVEVLSLRWEQIEGRWWTIPGEVAKNGLSHRVPLSRQARELLAELRGLLDDSPWVFASPNKGGAHLKTVSRTAKKIAKAAGIDDFVSHDLRRTAASHMTSMGIPRLVVSKILNHAESGVTAVYDRHSYDREKREALERWGDRVEEIVGGA